MKRQPRLTKKERKQQQPKAPPRPGRRALLQKVADNPYVSAMMEPDTQRLLVSEGMVADPRVNVWLAQLDANLDTIVADGGITRAQANQVLVQVNEWEDVNANQFKSREEAAESIAHMLDQVVATLPQITDGQQANALGRVVDAIHSAKASFVNTAKRIMLPDGQAAVETYLYCIARLWEGSQGVVQDFDGKSKRNGINLARQIWGYARDARVFEIPAQVWQSLHHQREQQFMAEVAAQQIPDDQVLDFLRRIAQTQPFPEKLPFDYTYVGLGPGVLLDISLARLRLPAEQRGTVVGVNLLGYLICGPNQQVYEMLHVILKDTDYFLPLAQRYDDSWPYGETLAAWLVGQMVEMINEHNTVVINHEPSKKMKDTYRKTGKGAPGFLPKPYYTVRLKHKVIDEAEEDCAGSGFGRVLAHRYDRRGHERFFIHRDTLPIDAKLEQKLLKYGYRFIVGRPDSEDAARLAYRAIPPKRSDEWMAVKVCWIDDTVVGDESLPYIPAVRVPEKPEL